MSVGSCEYFIQQQWVYTQGRRTWVGRVGSCLPNILGNCSLKKNKIAQKEKIYIIIYFSAYPIQNPFRRPCTYTNVQKNISNRISCSQKLMCVFYSMRPFEIKHLLTKAAYQQEGQNCSSRCPGLLVSVILLDQNCGYQYAYGFRRRDSTMTVNYSMTVKSLYSIVSCDISLVVNR